MFYDIGHTQYYSAGSQVTPTPSLTSSLNILCGKNHFLFSLRKYRAIPGEGGCCVHLTELLGVFFSSLLLSPFYSYALIFLLIFLLTVSPYSTCKCENQCLHNLNQLQLIKANHPLPGWAEMENSLCPNAQHRFCPCLSHSRRKW